MARKKSLAQDWKRTQELERKKAARFKAEGIPEFFLPKYHCGKTPKMRDEVESEQQQENIPSDTVSINRQTFFDLINLPDRNCLGLYMLYKLDNCLIDRECSKILGLGLSTVRKAKKYLRENGFIETIILPQHNMYRIEVIS